MRSKKGMFFKILLVRYVSRSDLFIRCPTDNVRMFRILQIPKPNPHVCTGSNQNVHFVVMNALHGCNALSIALVYWEQGWTWSPKNLITKKAKITYVHRQKTEKGAIYQLTELTLQIPKANFIVSLHCGQNFSWLWYGQLADSRLSWMRTFDWKKAILVKSQIRYNHLSFS